MDETSGGLRFRSYSFFSPGVLQRFLSISSVEWSWEALGMRNRKQVYNGALSTRNHSLRMWRGMYSSRMANLTLLTQAPIPLVFYNEIRAGIHGYGRVVRYKMSASQEMKIEVTYVTPYRFSSVKRKQKINSRAVRTL